MSVTKYWLETRPIGEYVASWSSGRRWALELEGPWFNPAGTEVMVSLLCLCVVKLSDVSLWRRSWDSLVADEDVMKPTKQKKKTPWFHQIDNESMEIFTRILSTHSGVRWVTAFNQWKILSVCYSEVPVLLGSAPLRVEKGTLVGHYLSGNLCKVLRANLVDFCDV